MYVRLLLLALAAAIVSATPLTISFIGIGSGTLGTTSFVDQSFSFVFNTDTSSLIYGPSSEPTDWATPSDTSAVFNVANVLNASLVSLGPIANDALGSTQSVFVHPTPEDRVGIWMYNDVDWLTLTDGPTGSPDTSPLANYNLQSNLTLNLPASAATLVGTLEDNPMPTADGNLLFSSIEPDSTITFKAQLNPTVTTTPPVPSDSTAAPEPSTLSLLLLGSGGILAGSIRRRVRR